MAGRWNREVFIQVEQASALFGTARAMHIAGEIYARSATRDTMILVNPCRAAKLSEYESQLPATVPVVTVHSRGHVVRFARRTVPAEYYDRWIIVGMHNAWDEHSRQVTHFNVIYEASIELVADIGVSKFRLGNIVNFSGVVRHYFCRNGKWVVERFTGAHVPVLSGNAGPNYEFPVP
ncbi:uncharacterized protein MELLADRAFT_86147 [Melampsora larici-populina 98AG31]|uniref:Uncharacterized protein n=1 Tax=Melampsora larici-populina (strain 98AG31 / pathotype 3-4-7) TaxID=747676 RepID=F4RLG2_MELLP|nr:uncharacterized protein MELLADRAFT_86147 [Melampsora larici-populina 98AG31]EGG06761.1 hypothetical protein MELLADRAFT_86147 [Melampsora larici-populina 98AG31]